MGIFKKKKKEKKIRNKKPLAERIIGFIFVGLIVGFFIYNVAILIRDTVSNIGGLNNVGSNLTDLSQKDFDKSLLYFDKNISSEDLARFYSKTGTNGANINIFTNGNFDYSKYSNETISFNSEFYLSGNELGVFINAVAQASEFSFVDKFLEIQILPIENSTKFSLNSILKLDLSILDTISTDLVGEIYLKTESQVSLVGQGIIVHESEVWINGLDDADNNIMKTELDSLIGNSEKGITADNFASYEIKSFINEFRKKTKCNVSRSENQILFSK